MTRRRRRRGGGDSLDLLLDTICNTFGGIVFIALLIVLLLRNVAPTAADAPAEVTAPEELERLAGRFAEAAAELASLRSVRSDIARQAEAFAPADVRDAIRDRNALAERVGALRAEHDRRVAENAAAAAGLRRAEAELESLAAAAVDAERRLDALTAELDAVRASKVREIRNPLVRTTDRERSVGLIVRYGRMYVWHRYDASGERVGPNTDEFVLVADEGTEVKTHPDPTKGVPLTDDAAAAVVDRLRPFPPARHSLEIVVRPDSFDAFATLRDAVVAAGYEYRLMPSDSPVADRGGKDERVQ